ncbi:MAG: protein kinase [Bacteroidia bacterium]|jgi:serine/threonine protein kinase|nr:protein kinase [Bacteroidia bacterium]
MLNFKNNITVDVHSLKLIGKGKNSHVYKGVNNYNQTVALKVIHTKYKEAALGLKQEAGLKFKTSALLTIEDYLVENDFIYGYRYWVDGLTLDKLMYTLKPSQIKEIILQLFTALLAMHEHQFLHLDIQPKNILLDKNFKLHLIDFVNGTYLPVNHNKRFSFNLFYSPPEAILNESSLFNSSSDLYAAGIILYEMIAKQKPFLHQNPEVLMNLNLAAPIDYNNFRPEMKKFLNQLCFKPLFHLPPTHLDSASISSLLTKSMNMRVQNAIEARTQAELLPISAFKTKPWWHL